MKKISIYQNQKLHAEISAPTHCTYAIAVNNIIKFFIIVCRASRRFLFLFSEALYNTATSQMDKLIVNDRETLI